MIDPLLHQLIKQIAVWYLFTKDFMHSLCLENLESITSNQKINVNVAKILIVTLTSNPPVITDISDPS